MGVLFVFFSPMAAFLPLFFLSVSQMIPLILSFAPFFGGPRHFRRIICPLPLAHVWVLPHRQYYWASRSQLERPCGLVCEASGWWLCCPKKLEPRDSEARLQTVTFLRLHQVVSQHCSRLQLVWGGLQVIDTYGISVCHCFLHSQFSSPQNF